MHRAALIKNKKKIEINIAVAFRETSQRATLCFEAAETQSQWLWWSCVIQHHYSSALLDEVSLFRIIYLTASPLQSMFDGNQMWGILHQGLLEHKRSVASTAKWKGVFIYLCIHLFKEPPQCLWLLKKYNNIIKISFKVDRHTTLEKNSTFSSAYIVKVYFYSIRPALLQRQNYLHMHRDF